MDLMREPGLDLSREIAAGERADAQIDSFISRRDAKRRESEGERAAEEAWEASSRLHEARLREERRAAWVDYHRGRADSLRRTLQVLIANHEAEAERLAALPEGEAA